MKFRSPRPPGTEDAVQKRKSPPKLSMPHLAKVLAHAERELAISTASSPGTSASRLPLYKRFLKIENHRLRLAHQAGGGGREICRRRVGLLDVFLRHLFADACLDCHPDDEAAAMAPAMLAIGGYGRGELNPHSDVDILFLHDCAPDKVPTHVNELIKHVLYVLWDIGFKVGHATRSIREACDHANDDNISKTALLEARLLAGRESLFKEFQRRFEKVCLRGHERGFPILAARRPACAAPEIRTNGFFTGTEHQVQSRRAAGLSQPALESVLP